MAKDKLKYKYFYRRNLPHLQPIDGIFFITYRLAFDLPRDVLNKLSELRKIFDSKLVKVNEIEQIKLKKICNQYLYEIEDNFLDNSKSSPQHLRQTQIARIVMESLNYNDGKLYDLYLAIIMPNHVHIVIKPLISSNKPISLSKIMKEHKSFTANECNKILHRSGQFWHHENYDHYIRDNEDYERIKDYILNNPVKAGLIDHYNNWKYKIVNNFKAGALSYQ